MNIDFSEIDKWLEFQNKQRHSQIYYEEVELQNGGTAMDILTELIPIVKDLVKRIERLEGEAALNTVFK